MTTRRQDGAHLNPAAEMLRGLQIRVTRAWHATTLPRGRCPVGRRLSTCRDCGKPVIFARVSNKAGRPPGRMPLNPDPDPDGNVAVYRDVTGALVARVVGKGGVHAGYERLMMPHFANCEKREKPSPAQTPSSEGAKREAGNVTSLDAWRRALAARGRAARNRRGRRPAAVTGVRVPAPGQEQR